MHMKMMLMGLFVILGSWGIKQIFASMAAYGLGGGMSVVTVQASQQAEVASETVDKRLEIYEEEQRDNPDRSKISELRGEIDEVRQEVSEDYAEDEIESQVDSAKGASLASSMATASV